MADEAWVALLGADPRTRLLASDEPAARWVALTELLDRPAGDPDAAAARAAVVADPGTHDLIGQLPDWEADNHLSCRYAPRAAFGIAQCRPRQRPRHLRRSAAAIGTGGPGLP